MSKYNIVMRQKNQSSTYDDLYPESLDTQIKIIFNSVGEFSANRFNSGLVEYCVYYIGAS